MVGNSGVVKDFCSIMNLPSTNKKSQSFSYHLLYVSNILIDFFSFLSFLIILSTNLIEYILFFIIRT